MKKRTRRRKTRPDRASSITPEMTILDIISAHRETEPLFKNLEKEK